MSKNQSCRGLLDFFRSANNSNSDRAPKSRGLRLETLEDRRLLSVSPNFSDRALLGEFVEATEILPSSDDGDALVKESELESAPSRTSSTRASLVSDSVVDPSNELGVLQGELVLEGRELENGAEEVYRFTVANSDETAFTKFTVALTTEAEDFEIWLELFDSNGASLSEAYSDEDSSEVFLGAYLPNGEYWLYVQFPEGYADASVGSVEYSLALSATEGSLDPGDLALVQSWGLDPSDAEVVTWNEEGRLTFLDCSTAAAEEIDLSGRDALTTFYCCGNEVLTRIRFDDLPSLSEVYVYGNLGLVEFELVDVDPSYLEVDGNTELRNFAASNCEFGSVYFSNCPFLSTVAFSECEIAGGAYFYCNRIGLLQATDCSLETLSIEELRLSELNLAGTGAFELVLTTDNVYSDEEENFTSRVVARNASGETFELQTEGRFDGRPHIDFDPSMVENGALTIEFLQEDSDEPVYSFVVTGNREPRPRLASPVVTATEICNSSIDLEISEVEGATRYFVEYSLDENYWDPVTAIFDAPGVKTFENLDPDATYYFLVKAIGAGLVDSKWVALEVDTRASLPGEEPNDTLETANDLGTINEYATYEFNLESGSDVDWYKFELPSDSASTFRALVVEPSYDHSSTGAVDVALYDASGSLVNSSLLEDGEERIEHFPAFSGVYYLRVYNDLSTADPAKYRLTIAVEHMELNERDLAVVDACGCDPNNSEQTIWNDDGRLIYLKCYGSSVVSLDLTGCEYLETFICSNNPELTSVDLSGLQNLDDVSIFDNPNLIALNIDNIDVADSVDIYRNNSLASLDITGVNVQYFNCDSNASLARVATTSCSSSNYFVLFDNPSLVQVEISDDSDLYLDINRCASLTSLDLKNCSSLKGLSVRNLPITALDLSGSTSISGIYVNNNPELTSLDLSCSQNLYTVQINDNPKLVDLNLDNVKATGNVYADYAIEVFRNDSLSSLDITGMSAWQFRCYSNASLERFSAASCSSAFGMSVTDNPLLSQVQISEDTRGSLTLNNCASLDYLDLSAWKGLNRLVLGNLPITSLDLTETTALRGLSVSNNLVLTSVDLSGLQNLNSVAIANNPALIDLNLNNAKISYYSPSSYVNYGQNGVFIEGNDCLKSLDITGLSAYKFYCYGNDSLESISATSCSSSGDFDIYDNPVLTQIDLSEDTTVNLEIYRCDGIASLDLTECASLKGVSIYDLPITSLDLSGLTSLSYVNVYDNANLIDLNLDNIKTSGEVFVYRNDALTSLDITGARAYSFKCYENATLEKFSASNCLTSSEFAIQDNPSLAEVDLSDNPEQSIFVVRQNAVEKLSVAGCSSLSYLSLEEQALQTLYLSGSKSRQLRFPVSDRYSTVGARYDDGTEIPVFTERDWWGNAEYYYFSTPSSDAKQFSLEFYRDGDESPFRAATVVLDDFYLSQGTVLSGLVDVSWARPWGEFKNCSTRLTWTSPTETILLTTGTSEGTFVFDATRVKDGPGALSLDYLDESGNVVGTSSVRAVVLNSGALVVDALENIVDDADDKLSLAEAINIVDEYELDVPIVFAQSLSGRTIQVDGTLDLKSARIDATNSNVAISADAVVASGNARLTGSRFSTNALTVSAPLEIVDSTIAFRGDAPVLAATAVATFERVVFEGAPSTWRVANGTSFIDPSFRSDVAFVDRSSPTLIGTLTADAEIVLTNSTFRVSSDATLAGSGALVFAGNGLEIAGSETDPISFIIASSATLRGSGRVSGQYFALRVEGSLEPTGALELAGDLILAPSGALRYGIASLRSCPTIVCAGSASLGGTVVLERVDSGFVPTSEDSFLVLRAASLDVSSEVFYATESMSVVGEMVPETTENSLVFTVGWISGARVVAVLPVNNRSVDASRPYVDVYFDRSIDPETFDVFDLAITTEEGETVELENPQSLNEKNNAFRIYFANDDRTNRTYSIQIGSDVRTPLGVEMNQNGAEPNGEASDAFVGSFEIETPDLRPSVAADAIPAVALLGTKFDFSFNVENVGTADAIGNWKNVVYLSKDASLSGDDYLLTTISQGSESNYLAGLAAGSVETQTAKFVFPLDNVAWIEDDYYLIVVVDSNSSVFETSETNNVWVSEKISLSYPELANLRVSQIIAPQTATAGSIVELVWDETNEGARDVREVRRDAIYISNDGTLENAKLIKTTRYTDAILSGETVRRRQTVTVPSVGYWGDVKFIVVADCDNSVPEDDETDNFLVSSESTTLAQTLIVSLSETTIDEGTQNVRGTVSRTGDLSEPLVVSIASNDPTELTVAEAVTIPAGQASAAFFYSAVKDDEYDSDSYVELSFSADGFETKYASVKVANIDYPTLSLSVSKYSLDEGEEFTLTVARSYVADKPITVRLVASSSSQLTLPASVVIPANEASVAVTVAVVDDDRPESVEEVKITATSPTFTSGTKTISILDDDEPTIAITLDGDAVSEGFGGGAFVGTVTRAESASSALRVRLTSSDPAKIGVPNEVSIPAGRTSVKFYGASYDNGTVDGDVLVTITATGVQENCDCSMSADSTGTATTEILVIDDDGAALTVQLSKAILSQGEENVATITVSRNTATDADLVVSLISSDPILTVPETITIPAGSASATTTIATNYDETFALESWATITATAPGFSRGTAKALVSDALWSDLRPANVRAVQSESDLSLFDVSYYVVNEGRIETRASWKEQVWLSTKPTLDADAQLVATFERADSILTTEGANSVYRSFSCSPLDMGDSVYWIVVVDSEETLTELCETNNLATSAEQNYVPPYAAVVQTDVEKADPSTPIPLYGFAYDVNTGARVGGVDVTIDISNGSITRTITATTEADGSFATTWTPLSTEVGSYAIGARRPGKTTSPVQDRFSIMKLSLATTRGAFNISAGQTVTGEFVVRNESSEPITNLGYRVEGLPDNVRLEVVLSSTIIPTGGSATVALVATALDASVPVSQAKLYLTSDDTRDAEVALGFNVYPSYAVLTSDKQILSASMTVGSQKIVEFEICNESGVETGPITVDLPSDLAWLSCVNGTTLDSLAPGEARTVQLLLNPSADLPLQMYQGRLVLHYGNTGLPLDFKFRAKSEVYSDLTIKAVDEWTYYTEDGPALSGASVKVVDSLTKQVVSVGTTGDDGLWSVVGLAEGYYDIYVDAENHNNYRETIYLDDDQTCEAFLQMQTVRYEWTVTPTTIEDEYDITIETIFETNVPAPVVTVSPALVDVSDMEIGEIRQIDFTIENHGLIAVYDFTPAFGSGIDYGEFVVTPLVDSLDVLSAKSSVVIPVIFERRASATSDAKIDLDEALVVSSGASGAARGVAMNSVLFDASKLPVVQNAVKPVNETDDELGLPLATTGGSCWFTTWYYGRYKCAGDRYVQVGSTVVHSWGCFVGGGSSSSGGGFWDWGGSGGSSSSGGGSCSSSSSVSVTSNCGGSSNDGDGGGDDGNGGDDGDDDGCHKCGGSFGGSISLESAILGKVLELVGKLFPAPFNVKDLNPQLSISVSGGVCCDCGGITGLGARIEAEVAGSVSAKLHWGPPTFELGHKILLLPTTDAFLNFTLDVGVDLETTITISGKYVKECGKDAEWCVSAGASVTLTAGAEVRGSAKIFAGVPGESPITGALVGVAQVSSGLTATGSYCTNSGYSAKVCIEPLELTLAAYVEYNGEKLGFEKTWTIVDGGCLGGPSRSSSSIQDDSEERPEDEETRYSLEEIYSYPDDLDYSDAGFAEALANYASADEAAELLGYSTRADLEADLGYVLNNTLSLDEFVQAYYDVYQKYHTAEKGVCAKVKLQLKHKAVLTRDAFDAKLVLENETDEPLSDVAVDIIIYDEWGNDVTNMFGIYPPTTENFYDADLDNLGDLEGMAAGVADWIFIPSTNCASDDPQRYSVGGILRYIAAGKEVAITMAPASITVYPQPELELNYFWQRDVIGDDPWTEEVEPSEPFELAVLVQNKGGGDAQNLRIISAQPEIVENEKGLLVDFTIVGSKIDGQDASNSLTVDFGTIPAGGTAVGQWFMESTLQGHFVDYNATFQHVNGFDDLQFSLIKSVSIHELIHTVQDDSDGADDLPDFLVNDNDVVRDYYDLPDTLYLSSGEVESVATTTDYSISGALGWDALTVDLTVGAANSGWNYVWVRNEDPGASDRELYRVVRSDGKELNSANFWQTHRTFIDGVDVKNENTLHILDKFESASDVYTYTLYYRSCDQTGPQIASLEELPSNIRVAPLESVDVEFSEPIAESTFTTANLTLTRNDGRNLIDNLVTIQKISDKVYRIAGLASATGADGAYKLTVSTLGIADVWGNIAETESATLEWINAVESPTVVGIDRPAAYGQNSVESLTIAFSQPVDPTTFAIDDLTLTLTRDSGENLLTSGSGATLIARSATEFVLSGLTALTSQDGEYVLSVKATGVRGTNGKSGVGASTVEWVKDSVGPTNAVWSGLERTATNLAFDALYLGFDEEIEFSTLTRADFTLTRDGVVVPLDERLNLGVLPESLKTTTSRQEWKLVGLRSLANEEGNYVLTVDLANVSDLAGNLGSGRFSVEWTLDATDPVLDLPDSIARDGREIALTGLSVEPGTVVRVYDDANSKELAAKTFFETDSELRFQLPEEGARRLRVRATDPAGNRSDALVDVRVDLTAPFVASAEIQDDSVIVAFSEPTNVQALIADGSILDAISVIDESTGASTPLALSQFAYDVPSRVLTIALDRDAFAERNAVVPLTLKIDGSFFRDAVGNMLRGSSSANSGETTRFSLDGTLATACSYSVPFLVDWNGDGVLDLLVGEKSADGLGRVQVRLNNGTNAAPSYADPVFATYRDANGEIVELTVPGQGCQGAAPRASDVDGDGSLDLFVGRADGTILFYRGEGTGANWTLTAPEFVTYGFDGAKTQLNVGSRAVFEICDWNLDGRVDLLVGSGNGKLYALVDSAREGLFDFRAANPLTSVDGTGELVLSAGRSAPTLADANGDGLLDIVSGDANGAFYFYLNVGTPANPKFGTPTPLTGVDANLELPNGAKRSRPFATDYDGDGTTDLLVGSSDGSVYVYRGLKSSKFNSDGEPGSGFRYSFDWNLVASQAPLETPGLSLIVSGTSIVAIVSRVEGATSYVLQYGTDPTFATFATATTSASGAREIAGLIPGTTYYFRVKATAEGFVDSEWALAQGTLEREPLSEPTLSVSAAKTAAVVKIGSVDGATSYVLQYGTDPTFAAFAFKVFSNSGSKLVSGLTPGATNYFRVKAIADSRLDSAWITVAATAKVAPSLAAPTLMVVPCVKTALATIGAVESATAYVLQYGTDPTFAACVSATCLASGELALTRLVADTTYYCRVKATALGFADSAWTTFETRTSEGFLNLEKPSVVVTPGKTGASIKIDPVEKASGFVLQYGTDPNFESFVTKSYSSAGVKLLSGLMSGSTYYFRVKAVSESDGYSEWTAIVASTKSDSPASSAVFHSDSVFDNYFEDELEEFWDVLAKSIAK